MASSSQNKDNLYDPIRKKWVAHTPEEGVRQALLRTMLGDLSYPKELLCVEKSLVDVCQHKEGLSNCSLSRRIDLMAFGKKIHPDHILYPLVVIECKESASMRLEAMAQVEGYNYFIRAPFVAIAYPGGVEWGYYQGQGNQYRFSRGLPPYPILMRAVGHGNYL